MVRAPHARPAVMAAVIASRGTSPWVSTIATSSIDWIVSTTCSAVRVALAPGMTTMRFIPLASTSMRAVPDEPSAVTTAVASMPSPSTMPRSQAPASSLPTAPIMLTRAPSRAAATAWLRPLPPACRSSVSPMTVSPGAGIRSRPTTRSRLRLPTTTTRPGLVRGVPEEALPIGEEALPIGEEALLMGQVSGAGCRPHP